MKVVKELKKKMRRNRRTKEQREETKRERKILRRYHRLEISYKKYSSSYKMLKKEAVIAFNTNKTPEGKLLNVKEKVPKEKQSGVYKI